MLSAAFAVLSVQAVMGAFDNFWHHELEAKLPSTVSARYELLLHTSREAIYAVLFAGLAWAEWRGAWAWGLAALLLVEIVITLADFIEEDLTRRLPPLERVLHTMLALSYGAFAALLAPVAAGWAAAPTAVGAVSYGWVSWLLTLYAVGVGGWSIRNGIATARLFRLAAAAPPPPVAGHGPAVLVTGGTGFIGQALVRRLVAEGRRVIVLSRDARRARTLLGPAVHVVESLDALLPETRLAAVVNLAGAPVAGGPWTPRRRRVLLDSRIGTTKAILGLLARLEHRPAVLVSASAVGLYGARPADEPLMEDAGGRPGEFQSDLCRAWEMKAARAEAWGCRVVMLRLGIVLGRDGGMFPLLDAAARFGLGAVLGDGRQPFPWVHLDDAIGLIQHAMRDGHMRGPVNAVAPDCPAQGGFVQALARRHGRGVRLRVPASWLRAWLGGMADLLVAGRRAVPWAALEAGYCFAAPTLQVALDRLAGPAAVRRQGGLWSGRAASGQVEQQDRRPATPGTGTADPAGARRHDAANAPQHWPAE